jgi:transcription elongation factor GreB
MTGSHAGNPASAVASGGVRLCFSLNKLYALRMSKAFTRESDDSDFEEVTFSRPTLPSGTRNYITKEGAARLNQKLKVLREKKLAASNQTDQRKLEAGIRHLQVILDSIVVAEIPADQQKAAFGARVTVRDGKGEEDTYRIVGVDEANPEHGEISWISPLARAIMSRRVGDTLSFQSPSGTLQLTILKVSYSEER